VRIIVGITGATGAIYGVRALERLRERGIETHLVLSRWGVQTLLHETTYTREQVEALADEAYKPDDLGAAISSGSFETAGMIVAPCSAKSLSAIAHGYGDSLIHRAADVVLKERRKLLLAVRETPLSEIHLDNMLRLARMGVVILPPVPAFYNHPSSIDDIVEHTVDRMLDQFGVAAPGAARWTGDMGLKSSS
jgi:4-hydroxy-3-polyprenylbenzoate decarboxylase